LHKIYIYIYQYDPKSKSLSPLIHFFQTKTFAALLTLGQAAFRDPEITGCDIGFSWSEMDSAIELMGSDGTFHEMGECPASEEYCSMPLSKLGSEPWNLFEGQLLTMRGNGPYAGRYYYNWNADPSTKVSAPQMSAKMRSGSLILEWPGQIKAKEYEIHWKTDA